MISKIVGTIAIALVGVSTAIYFWPGKNISGDEFKALVLESLGSPLSVWYLYREYPSSYCFKLTKVYFPDRYCVSKNDLEVIGPLSADKRSNVRLNQLALREGRYPGAVRETF